MAIGKVDAYATVQAPNVDFGDIALNAQKFQEADLERKKALKEAELKANVYKKSDDVKLDPSNIINGTIRSNYNRNIDKAASRLQELADIKANRAWTNDEITENQNLNSLAKTLKNRETLINEGLKSLPPLIEKSSMLSSDEVDAYQGLASGKGIYVDTNSSGDDVNIYVWKRDKDGNLIKREDGQFGGYEPITRANDKGEEEPLVITGDSIANGDFKKQFYQKNDIDNSIPKMFAEGAGLYSSTNENGVVTIHTKGVTQENINRVELNIKNRVNEDAKLTGDVLAQTAATRGEDPKMYSRIPKSGWSEEQKQRASNILFNRTKARFDGEFSRTTDEGELRAQREESMKKYRLSLVPVTVSKNTSPDVISKGFVTIPDAVPTANAGYTVYKLNNKTTYQVPAGSTLTGVTKGKGGSALVRIAIPLNKSELYKVAKDNGWKGINSSKTQEENEAELSSYTKGKTTREDYYFAPEVTVNSMLQGNSSIKDYDQVRDIVVDPNWRAPKKATKKTTSNVKSR